MGYIWEKVEFKNGNPSEKILVLARTHDIFQAWASIYGINPDSPNVKLVSMSSDLLDHTGVWYADLGTDNHELRIVFDNMKKTHGLKPIHE